MWRCAKCWICTVFAPGALVQGRALPRQASEKVDMVIFRENTEDIYAGIEFEAGTPEAKKFLDLFKQNFPKQFAKIRFPGQLRHRPQARLEGRDRSIVPRHRRVRHRQQRKSVTIVHKGNIMKIHRRCVSQLVLQARGTGISQRRVHLGTMGAHQGRKGRQEANAQMDAAKRAGKIIIKDAICGHHPATGVDAPG